MSQTIQRLFLSLLIVILVSAGCRNLPSTELTAVSPVAPESSLDTPSVAPPGFASWDDVLKQACGTTLNWYLQGGSAAINSFVDNFYGDVLMEEFDITLNRVPVADTRDAVNLVLSQTEAGKKQGGSVDLIWINGQNFFTLQQANLLYGPWAESIPNSTLINWDNPAVAYDFGSPVNGYESPWSSAQFQFIYDSARMDPSDLPRTYDELMAWIKAHPGRFTYIAPGLSTYQTIHAVGW